MIIPLPSRPFEGMVVWLCFLSAALVGTSVSVPKLHLDLLLHLLLNLQFCLVCFSVVLASTLLPRPWVPCVWELDMILAVVLPSRFLARLLACIQAAGQPHM